MTGVPRGGGRRGGSSERAPRSDASSPRPSAEEASSVTTLRGKVFEAVELAAARAEELVATHCGRSVVRGVTIIIIDFDDFDLLSAFQAAGLIRRCATSGAWKLVRSWGGAEEDVELGEAMGRRSPPASGTNSAMASASA